ncbi:MAG TPA: hypothetical protein VLV86_04390 [Vicinamibacterales bacterium]|nr:hypothetical protein [Vicinamibacterales bacterium]
MKANGSIYVAAVFAALAGYFVYQWWFNPNRMVKSRLGEIATALSIPSTETQTDRLTRLARLRTLATADLHVSVGKDRAALMSRDEVVAAIAGFVPPPGGWNVDFVDADVLVNADDTARAYVTADMTTRDPLTGQQTLDSRDVTLSFVKQGGEWLVREAAVGDLPMQRSR